MWQLETAATNASSGSTASATEIRQRARSSGDDDAGTAMPPSKLQLWPRL